MCKVYARYDPTTPLPFQTLLMLPPFFSCDDFPKYSNATPRPYISSSWIGHKPLTPLANSILLQPSPDMVFSLFSSKQAMMSLYQNAKFFVTDPTGDSSSFLLSRGIRQGCPISSSSLFRHSPQISTPFSKKFSLIHLGLIHSHTHLLTLNMLMTQFSLPVLTAPSADLYIFSNTWPHELVFS